MSRLPSLLKSATVIPCGAMPVARVVFSVNCPAPLPLKTWIVLERLLTTARSAQASRLKSAVITCLGDDPVVYCTGAPKVPLPYPVRTARLPSDADTTATSSAPSPFQSPTASPLGVIGNIEVLSVGAKLPPPLPRFTAMSWLRRLEVIRSGKPSLLASANAVPEGRDPVGSAAMRLKVPSPKPLI